MGQSVSIERFICAIEQLPSDPPVDNPRKWYKTQKEHWLGWLNDYHGPGAYGRQTDKTRDAKYAYNHIVEPKMLLWIIEAAGVDPDAISAARNASASLPTMQQQSAAIRRVVPWETLEQALWGSQPKRVVDRIQKAVVDRIQASSRTRQ
jgi:hypothetical protein